MERIVCVFPDLFVSVTISDTMTLNEFAMFVAGVVWGIFIIEPIWRIARKIYQNAKEAQNGNNRKT